MDSFLEVPTVSKVYYLAVLDQLLLVCQFPLTLSHQHLLSLMDTLLYFL